MAGRAKLIFLIVFIFSIVSLYGCSVDTHVPVGSIRMRFAANEIERVFGMMGEVSLEGGLAFYSETRNIDGKTTIIATIKKNECVAAVAYGYERNNEAKIFFYDCKQFDIDLFAERFMEKLEYRKINMELEMKGVVSSEKKGGAAN